MRRERERERERGPMTLINLSGLFLKRGGGGGVVDISFGIILCGQPKFKLIIFADSRVYLVPHGIGLRHKSGGTGLALSEVYIRDA